MRKVLLAAFAPLVIIGLVACGGGGDEDGQQLQLQAIAPADADADEPCEKAAAAELRGVMFVVEADSGSGYEQVVNKSFDLVPVEGIVANEPVCIGSADVEVPTDSQKVRVTTTMTGVDGERVVEATASDLEGNGWIIVVNPPTAA